MDIRGYLCAKTEKLDVLCWPGLLQKCLFQIRTGCHKLTTKTKTKMITGRKILNGVRQNKTSIMERVLCGVLLNRVDRLFV